MSDVFMMNVDGREHEYRQVIANGIPTVVGYGANLAFSDLSGVDLSGLDLSFANLRGAELTLANLSGCNLSFADLTDASAIGADLRGATLRGTVTENASLTMADLRGATYDQRSVRGAFLSDELTPQYLASIGIIQVNDSTVGGGARGVLDVERATDIARGETTARGEFTSATLLEVNPEPLLGANAGLVAASRGSALARGGHSRDYSELLAGLTAGIAELTTSEQWARYLDVQSKFYSYSSNNVMLIMMQNPDATRVAGYRKWQEMGRQVLAKESALRILAPMVYKKDGPEGEKTSEIRGFKLVPVFDIAQTEGPDLPEVANKLEGLAPEGVFDKLVVFAQSIGFRVERPESLDSGANGDTSHSEGRIRVVASNSPAQQTKTLAHEIGHALLHDPESPTTKDVERGRKELEAESTAYVICTALGLDTSDYSFGYVAGWAGGGPEAIAGVKESAGRIQKASTAVMKAFEAEEPLEEVASELGIEKRSPQLETEVAGNVELDSNQNRSDPWLDELTGPVQVHVREDAGPDKRSQETKVDPFTRDVPTRGYLPLSGSELDVLSTSSDLDMSLEI